MNQFHQAVQHLQAEFNQKLNRGFGGMRKYTDEQMAKLAGRLDELSRVTSAMAVLRSGGTGAYQGAYIGSWRERVKYIEDIPGRRVPYTLVIDIPIGADETGVEQGSEPISQEGPFVAVKRMATFQSSLQVEVTDPTNPQQISAFAGRSFGRYRPIHSVCDIMDAQHNAIADTSTWWLNFFNNPGALVGTALPGAALGLPSNMSSFRTMEFDGRLEVINAGSSYPRQNESVPSPFWSSECNTPMALGALDFWERGETLTVKVEPTHVNNPPAGNVDGAAVFPVRTAPALPTAGWPFVEGQYDAHEGISTAQPATLGQNVAPLQPALLTTDSVARVPNGILTVAWEGYRIIQPVGPAG